MDVGGNYAKVAEGLNVAARRVEKPADIVPAIKEAVGVTQSGAPFLIEIVAKQATTFRAINEGALMVIRWRRRGFYALPRPACGERVRGEGAVPRV